MVTTRRKDRLHARTNLGAPGEQPTASERHRAGGHPHHEAVGNRVETTVHDGRMTRRRIRQFVAQTEFADQTTSRGHPSQIGVGSLIDAGEAREGRGTNLSTDIRR